MYAAEAQKRFEIDEEFAGQCGKDSFFYIQHVCVIDETRQHMRQTWGLLIACIVIFVYFFSVVYFDYIFSVQVNKYVDYDVKTITAGDYTMEFDINIDQYHTFKKLYFDHRNPISEIAQFKLYVQSELEKRIDQISDRGYEEVAAGEKHHIKIAQITFAFHNEKVIRWLSQRGAAIKAENWDKLDLINKQINEGLDDETKHHGHSFLDLLQTPCSIFATFESEEGLRRACIYNTVIDVKHK